MSLWDKREDMIVHEEAPFNAEPPRTALAHGPVTPTDTFYARNHGPIPDIDSASWRLRVDGLTDRALELSLTDLQETFPVHEIVATLQCAGNQRAGLKEVRDIPGEDPWGPAATSTARCAGTRLADVLSAAGLQPDRAIRGVRGARRHRTRRPAPALRWFDHREEGDRRRGAPGVDDERSTVTESPRSTRASRRPRLHRCAQRQMGRSHHGPATVLHKLLSGRRLPAATRRDGPERDRTQRRSPAWCRRSQRRHPPTRRPLTPTSRAGHRSWTQAHLGLHCHVSIGTTRPGGEWVQMEGRLVVLLRTRR